MMLQQQPQPQKGTMLQQQQQKEQKTAGSQTLHIPRAFEAWHYEFEYFFKNQEEELEEEEETGNLEGNFPAGTATKTSKAASSFLWNHNFISVDDEDLDNNAKSSNEQVHTTDSAQKASYKEWLSDAQADMNDQLFQYQVHHPATQPHHLQQQQQESHRSDHNHKQEKPMMILLEQQGRQEMEGPDNDILWSNSLVQSEWNDDLQHYDRGKDDRICRSSDPMNAYEAAVGAKNEMLSPSLYGDSKESSPFYHLKLYKTQTMNNDPNLMNTPCCYFAPSVLETEHTKQYKTISGKMQASQSQPQHTWQQYAMVQEKQMKIQQQQQQEINSPSFDSEAAAGLSYVFFGPHDAGVAKSQEPAVAACVKRNGEPPASPERAKKKTRTTTCTTGLNRIWDDPDRPKRSRSAYNYFFQHERAKMLQESRNKITDNNQDLKTTQQENANSTNGIITFACMGREIGKKWKTLDKETRAMI